VENPTARQGHSNLTKLAAAKTQHAAPFVAWLIVTGRLGVDAGFLVAAGMRLGSAAARYHPAARLRFAQATARLAATAADTALQWHMLATPAATQTTVEGIDTERFLAGRQLLLDAYRQRGRPDTGRNPAAVLHRLQTTLFHDQAIDSITRPGHVPSGNAAGPVSPLLPPGSPALRRPGQLEPAPVDRHRDRAGPALLRPLARHPPSRPRPARPASPRPP
jgi:hypothetical protein